MSIWLNQNGIYRSYVVYFLSIYAAVTKHKNIRTSLGKKCFLSAELPQKRPVGRMRNLFFLFLVFQFLLTRIYRMLVTKRKKTFV